MADASEYLTPNATLTGVPDVVPRPDPASPYSPASDEYRTPDTTLAPDGTPAMPTYFDRKRAAAAVAAAVEPLANFRVLKQKSLNTIPALLERGKRNEELFNNFPFLTPLAHRKSSLATAATRLSGCLEDEFYCIPSEPEAELGSSERVDVRHRFRSASSRALHDPAPALATSTPRADPQRHSYTDRTR